MLKEIYEKGKVRMEIEERFPEYLKGSLVVKTYKAGVNTPAEDWITDDVGLGRAFIIKAFARIDEEEHRKLIDDQISKLGKARQMISDIADTLVLDDHCPLRSAINTSIDGLEHIAHAIRG